ncbi:hybrid sensor histidine kinase/response regulator [Hoeflea prorocentri]|uniref:histidine kinase n=1 Tax=Hoeflea prorocentri TaxID=1922333 RepID=A0A9X3UGY6_9HYPH|nr:hybrid sensor histidine kinase/response regulator [Hoeflea prorocentri]MCY6381137.1 hybrid sensor histidine kinase/response regulator [Hoeflea prorocentri]MDA5398937.1 hybrid sensor histidine kinase/response regulator [Hoeflea prorocentri]
MTQAEAPVDDRLIEIRIAQQLLTRSPIATTSSFLFALLCVTLLHDRVPTDIAAGWLVSVFVAGCLPFAYMAVQRRHPFSRSNIRTYLFFNTLNALISGLVWGIGMSALTDTSSAPSIANSFLAILAYSTAAVVSHGAFPRSYAAAAGSALLIYGSFLIVSAPAPEWRFGFVSVIMFLPYMLIARNIHRTTVSGLVSRQRHDDMVETLRQQRDAIEKINDDKTRFLAATSHDLAQPLHAQGNYIAALHRKLTQPDQYELLQKIEASWRSMGSMLEGLVDISRLETGSVVPNIVPVELSALVFEIVDEFAEVADQKQIQLSADTYKAVTDTDPYLFSRVLRNVVSNAIKFTPPHGRVIARFRQDGEDIVFDIQDTGIGIPADKIGQVFDEYIQLQNDERDRTKGLGLGLSIVRRLCNLLEIDHQLVSHPEKGSCFTFRLRQSRSIPETTASKSEQRDALRMSVLVVDDERTILDSMSVILSDWGCEVFCAPSVSQAVELVKTLNLSPDVLITDLRLPGTVGGSQLVDLIRTTVKRNLPAIIMTGNIKGVSKSDLPSDALLLTKPVDAGTLYHELSQINACGSDVA